MRNGSMTKRGRSGNRLNLERLEGRELMAVQILEADGILLLRGDNRNNSVQIYDVDGVATEGEFSYIEVLADGRSYVTSTEITRIDVDLGGGNDSLLYDLGDPSLFQTYFPNRELNAFLGRGNDTVTMRVNGFTFEADPSLQALGPGNWTLNFDLGAGNDRLFYEHTADLLGIDRGGDDFNASNLTLFVNGAAGNDLIQVDIQREIDVQLARFDVTLRGGSGNDILTARSAGEIRAEEADVFLERYGESGNDRILGALGFQSQGNAAIDQIIDTGGGNDQVNTLMQVRSRRNANVAAAGIRRI
jgi:hypothetical protein